MTYVSKFGKVSAAMRNRFLEILDSFRQAEQDALSVKPVLQAVKDAYSLSQLVCVNHQDNSIHTVFFADAGLAPHSVLNPILSLPRSDPILEIRRDDFAVMDDVAAFRRMGKFGFRLCVERSPSTRTTLLAMSDMPEGKWKRLRPFYFRDLLVFAHLLNNLIFRPQLSEPQPVKFSGREKQCIESLAKGLRPKQIAGNLKISEHAVRLYIRRARAKLNAATMSEATVKAIRYGLISGS